MKKMVCFALLSQLPQLLLANDLSALYSRTDLAGSKVGESILLNFREVVLPVLTPEERRVLQNVKFEFPLTGPVEMEPFCYYSSWDNAGGKVVMSLESLRFFRELSVAYAWLQKNGYVPDTVGEYVSMLKYRPASSFPEGKYPPPFIALQVPANADNENAPHYIGFQNMYKSAVVFILCHELGHIFYKHLGSESDIASEESRQDEEEADSFAVDVMRRIGEAPVGMTTYFMSWAHWENNRWDFPDEKKYREALQRATHPLTAHRLSALAKKIEKSAADFARKESNPAATVQMLGYVATQISLIGKFLDDADVQQAIALAGAATDLSSLAPRHRGEFPVARRKSSAKAGERQTFDGNYQAQLSDKTGTLPARMILERKGDAVSGTYSFGLGVGKIKGQVKNGTLFYDWSSGTSRGKGTLRPDANGEMTRLAR